MKTAKHLFIFVFVIGASQCVAGPFAPDTIDNWQIYARKKLIIAGNQNINGNTLTAEIAQADLDDLAIQYNHDHALNGEVTIKIVESNGTKVVHNEGFVPNRNDRMKLSTANLNRVLKKGKSYLIKYKESKSKGTDIILGRFTFK